MAGTSKWMPNTERLSANTKGAYTIYKNKHGHFNPVYEGTETKILNLPEGQMEIPAEMEVIHCREDGRIRDDMYREHVPYNLSPEEETRNREWAKRRTKPVMIVTSELTSESYHGLYRVLAEDGDFEGCIMTGSGKYRAALFGSLCMVCQALAPSWTEEEMNNPQSGKYAPFRTRPMAACGNNIQQSGGCPCCGTPTHRRFPEERIEYELRRQPIRDDGVSWLEEEQKLRGEQGELGKLLRGQAADTSVCTHPSNEPVDMYALDKSSPMVEEAPVTGETTARYEKTPHRKTSGDSRRTVLTVFAAVTVSTLIATIKLNHQRTPAPGPRVRGTRSIGSRAAGNGGDPLGTRLPKTRRMHPNRFANGDVATLIKAEDGSYAFPNSPFKAMLRTGALLPKYTEEEKANCRAVVGAVGILDPCEVADYSGILVDPTNSVVEPSCDPGASGFAMCTSEDRVDLEYLASPGFKGQDCESYSAWLEYRATGSLADVEIWNCWKENRESGPGIQGDYNGVRVRSEVQVAMSPDGALSTYRSANATHLWSWGVAVEASSMHLVGKATLTTTRYALCDPENTSIDLCLENERMFTSLQDCDSAEWVALKGVDPKEAERYKVALCDGLPKRRTLDYGMTQYCTVDGYPVDENDYPLHCPSGLGHQIAYHRVNGQYAPRSNTGNPRAHFHWHALSGLQSLQDDYAYKGVECGDHTKQKVSKWARPQYGLQNGSYLHVQADYTSRLDSCNTMVPFMRSHSRVVNMVQFYDLTTSQVSSPWGGILHVLEALGGNQLSIQDVGLSTKVESTADHVEELMFVKWDMKKWAGISPDSVAVRQLCECGSQVMWP